IVVERHLGIESEDPVILGHDERIDLNHGGIEIAERTVAAEDACDSAADLLQSEAKTEGKLPRLKRLEANCRLDHNLQDFFGMLFGDLLDFHAAEARCDDPHPLDLPVENEAEVNLPLERFGDLNIDSLNDLALWAGLIGDEGFAKKLRRRRAHFIIGLAELDASRLAAAAGMDLGLHGPMPAAEFGRAIDRLLGTISDRPMRCCHTKIRQDLLGLILVNVQTPLLTTSLQPSRHSNHAGLAQWGCLTSRPRNLLARRARNQIMQRKAYCQIWTLATLLLVPPHELRKI